MKDYLTTSEVAREIGVCQRTIHAWHKKGWLLPDTITPGGRAMYDVANIRLFMRDMEKMIVKKISKRFI